MAVQVTCPACEAAFNVSESLLGKTLRCKSCKQTFKARATRTDDDEPADRDSPPAKRPARPRDDRDEEPGRRPRKESARSRARDEDDDVEEDDEDERPVRKSGRKAQKKSSVSFYIGAAAAFLLLVGAVIWVVVGSGYFDKKKSDRQDDRTEARRGGDDDTGQPPFDPEAHKKIGLPAAMTRQMVQLGTPLLKRGGPTDYVAIDYEVLPGQRPPARLILVVRHAGGFSSLDLDLAGLEPGKKRTATVDLKKDVQYERMEFWAGVPDTSEFNLIKTRERVTNVVRIDVP